VGLGMPSSARATAWASRIEPLPGVMLHHRTMGHGTGLGIVGQGKQLKLFFREQDSDWRE